MDRKLILHKEINLLKKNKDFQSALPLAEELWTIEKNSYNGHILLQCLRKTENFTKARELLVELNAKYYNYPPINNEELWLDYSEKIKNLNNPNILIDARNILLRTDKYDKYTGMIYNKTVLKVVDFLISEVDAFNSKQQYAEALTWLKKLDYNALSNEPFSFLGQKYPSDRQNYYSKYALVLIKLNKYIDYVDKYLNYMNFEIYKKSQFRKNIIDFLTYTDFVDQSIKVKDFNLRLFIKNCKEEIYRRENKLSTIIFNPKKTTLISDLGDFVFCPVSFAINETYSIQTENTFGKSDIIKKRKYLVDRIKEYKSKSSFSEIFNDTQFDIDNNIKQAFHEIFTSNIIFNHLENPNKTYFSNNTDSLRGVPDYVLENSNQKRFVVLEKFSKKISNGDEQPFGNDLIKLYAYMFELTSLGIDFGYLVYWYWNNKQINNTDIEKSNYINIQNYKVFRIEKTKEREQELCTALMELNQFKLNGSMVTSGDGISYPNKCLNCSVFSYCNHKTGKFNSISFPYNIDELEFNKTR